MISYTFDSYKTLCCAQVNQILLSPLNRCRSQMSNQSICPNSHSQRQEKNQGFLAPSPVLLLTISGILFSQQPCNSDFQILASFWRRQLKQLGCSTKYLHKVCTSVISCKTQCTLSCDSWTQSKLSTPLPPEMTLMMWPWWLCTTATCFLSAHSDYCALV